MELEWDVRKKMNGCRNMMPCLKGVEETMLENISFVNDVFVDDSKEIF